MRYFFIISGFLSLLAFFLFHQEDHPIHVSPLSNLQIEQSGSGFVLQASVDLPSERTAFYFSFPRYTQQDMSDIYVVWHDGNTDYRRSLDIEDLDMRGYDSHIFSEPWINSGRKQVSFSIFVSKKINPGDLQLFTSYSVGGDTSSLTTIAQAGTTIISRAQWGADESYRYADGALQKSNYTEYLNYVQSPKTKEQIVSIQQNDKREENMESLFPDTQKPIFIRRYENGHKLVWPIEKTRQVDRIVIHHTAESLDKEADDTTYLRDIYKYHAISRGWGDIGYNYVIGQRGTIYEGRAGGDYVIGGHVPANNPGSIGISVIGNFELFNLNKDQKTGLENAISYVAEKYGINLSEKKPAVYRCNNGEDCSNIVTHLVGALAGHRDYNATSCPGQNIYKEIPEFIARLSHPYSPQYNTESFIDPFPTEEILNLNLKNPVILTSSFVSTPSLIIGTTRYIGQRFRVKLSYPEKINATLTTADGKIGKLLLDTKIIPMKISEKVQVGIVGNDKLTVKVGDTTYTGSVLKLSHTVVRIDSWNRIPEWDKTAKYNDNLFRDTVRVINQNGAITLINDLPIEWYLKGMGEVSNSDPAEKIKTIIVSARSYARWYMDPKNRKFPTNLYDGSDNPDEFQKYLGYSYELRSPNVARLVDTTRNEVITYVGKLIKPWYHSSSDGRTLSALEYCQKNGSTNCIDIPYLQSVVDPGGEGHTRSGHGVGISGIGSTYWAQTGWSYQKIIQYYLQGVEIQRK